MSNEYMNGSIALERANQASVDSLNRSIAEVKRQGVKLGAASLLLEIIRRKSILCLSSTLYPLGRAMETLCYETRGIGKGRECCT
jgi:hypothetical protein